MRVLEVTMVLEKLGNVHVSNVSFELNMQYATGQRRRFEITLNLAYLFQDVDLL